MKIRKEFEPRTTEKRLLAVLHENSLYRARQVQAICYVSLITNVVLVLTFIYLFFGGK
ncbi:hypothetical protein [Enterococcus thailandicus]|uniref:hypothetical protein n=1 Tax=Enterococcus thailandicus TaxID=417368 RepID=UPI0022E22CC6|nr:hypothetical protein [Enterococcus thailandicus]